MTEQRYDVLMTQHGLAVEEHFCREYGCYGTDPDHGVSWDDAKDEMVGYHASLAEKWAGMTEQEWRNDFG